MDSGHQTQLSHGSRMVDFEILPGNVVESHTRCYEHVINISLSSLSQIRHHLALRQAISRVIHGSSTHLSGQTTDRGISPETTIP